MNNILCKQMAMRKTLRQTEYFGIGSYFLHLGRDVNGTIKKFVGTDSRIMEEMKSFFSSGYRADAQMVSFVIITECSENDPALDIIAQTALNAAVTRFSRQNILVSLVKNPYMTRDAANVPLKSAEALYNGWMMFHCNQGNVLGANSKRAIFSLSVNLDATGKSYQNDTSRHTNSTYPATIMFQVQDNASGNRLYGGTLSDSILGTFIGKSGYVTASCYGVAQKPSRTDSSGEIIPDEPVIKFSHHDNVQISNPDFSLFDRQYHGLLMAYPYLNNYQLVRDANGVSFAKGSAVYKCIEDALNQIEMPDPFTLTLGVLTTNKKKVVELRNVLSDTLAKLNRRNGNQLSKYKINVVQIKFNSMVEEQILDPVECIESKIDKTRLVSLQISALLGVECIFIDDTSFAVDALGMQPGTFYKQHYEKGEADNKAKTGMKYNNFICSAVNSHVERMKEEARRTHQTVTEEMIDNWRLCYATTIFATVIATPWGTTIDSILRSTVDGIIPEHPFAIDTSKEFGWDPIVVPRLMEDETTGNFAPGNKLTYQSMNDKQLALSKPRSFALSKMLTTILALRKGVVPLPEEYDFGMTIEHQKKSCEQMSQALAVINHAITTKTVSIQNATSSAVNPGTVNGIDLASMFSN